jgi:hypothetical protein
MSIQSHRNGYMQDQFHPRMQCFRRSQLIFDDATTTNSNCADAKYIQCWNEYVPRAYKQQYFANHKQIFGNPK